MLQLKEIPHYYLTIESNVDKLISLRKKINSFSDVKISFNDLIVKAIAIAVEKNPKTNASWNNEKIINYETIDVAVAIALEDGLITPIVKKANSKDLKEISKIMITASGGPFREKTFKELSEVTLQDALKHPTWSMGTKITIDSATLVNKCLELIEAHYLFQIPESQIEVVVHPQSIIHSIVTYVDGSSICQLSKPDMRIPIAHALSNDCLLYTSPSPRDQA